MTKITEQTDPKTELEPNPKPDGSPESNQNAELQKIAEEIQQEIGSPLPEPSSEVPDFNLNLTPVFRGAANWYVKARKRQFEIPPHRADEVFAPWNRIAGRIISRHLPWLAKQDPDLVSGMLLLGQLLIEIEQSPKIVAAGASNETETKPETVDLGNSGFPTVDELNKPPSIR